LTAKGLKAGKVAETGKIGEICYQFATNFSNYSPQWAKGLIVQGQPKFCFRQGGPAGYSSILHNHWHAQHKTTKKVFF
jgi:hypothetical protein